MSATGPNPSRHRPPSPAPGPPLAGPATLTVVIVNYNGWPDVARLVEALGRSPEVAGGRCEVVVVDNASDEPPPAGLAESRPWLRLILRPENGGFAAGVNEGWRAARTPWLLLLNYDVVVEPELIGGVLALAGRYEARPGGPPGVVGLGLRNPDGTRQPSVGAFPSLARSIWGQVIPRSRRKYQASWRTRPGPVPWVTGACVLVRSELLTALGGMDEDFFLYYEEVALCRAARRQGWSVEYEPAVEVVHLRPLQSRRLTPAMRLITRHSQLLYFQKHLPIGQFRGLAAIVGAEAALRGAWARLRSDHESRRAWDAIGRMVRDWRITGGPPVRGVAVRALAESVRAPR